MRSVLGGVGRRLPPNLRRIVNLARGIDAPVLVDRPLGRRVAVLAPHPDDELIGCGGTLAKHLDGGERVWVVFATSGERSVGLLDLPASERGPAREREAVTAMESLGVREEHLRFLRVPDGKLDGGAAAAVAGALGAIAPDLVYAPFPVDAHRDHAGLGVALARALEEVTTVARVALYEVWTPLVPTHVVDVTATLDRKLTALGCYRSAVGAVDYAHTARGLAAFRSAHAMSGRGFAEAFAVIAPADLRSLLPPGR